MLVNYKWLFVYCKYLRITNSWFLSLEDSRLITKSKWMENYLLKHQATCEYDLCNLTGRLFLGISCGFCVGLLAASRSESVSADAQHRSTCHVMYCNEKLSMDMSGFRISAFEGNLEVTQTILRKTGSMIVFRNDYAALFTFILSLLVQFLTRQPN